MVKLVKAFGQTLAQFARQGMVEPLVQHVMASIPKEAPCIRALSMCACLFERKRDEAGLYRGEPGFYPGQVFNRAGKRNQQKVDGDTWKREASLVLDATSRAHEVSISCRACHSEHVSHVKASSEIGMQKTCFEFHHLLVNETGSGSDVSSVQLSGMSHLQLLV